jgi:hypothetical protein
MTGVALCYINWSSLRMEELKYQQVQTGVTVISYENDDD